MIIISECASDAHALTSDDDGTIIERKTARINFAEGFGFAEAPVNCAAGAHGSTARIDPSWPIFGGFPAEIDQNRPILAGFSQ